MNRLRYGLCLLLAAAACNSKNPSAVAPVPRTGGDSSAAAGAPAGTLGVSPLPADPREAMLAKGVEHMLQSEHLRKRPVDDALSRDAFAEYLDRLDPGKLFLLREHVTALETHADRMDDQLRDGNLELARFGAALMARRQEAVATIVAERLAQPFDFVKDEQLETDPEKRDYASTETELADRWRKVLKLQVLERIERMQEMADAVAKAKTEPETTDEPKPAVPASLQNIPPTFEGREARARDELAKSFQGRFSRLTRLEPLEPVEAFLNAVATVYDPHTMYLAPADKENFDIEMSGQLEGIGAVLVEDDHYIEVREVVPGGASWRQGQLEAGDLILAVAQEGKEPVDVADMRINEVVKMIRGPKGTVVTLTIKKPDDRIQVLAITRDVVQIEAAYARGAILDLGPKHEAMGYVLLPSFYGNTRSNKGNTAERNATDDVLALLEELSKRKVGGVIIDLRSNGGGLLDHARDITGFFIPTGPVVQTRQSDGESQILSDSDPSVAFGGDVVVLVDRFSASASEILAGALQDYGRAVVVGTGPTHGKGTVQVLLDLDRMQPGQGKPLGVLKLTIQQFFRVDGDSTQWRGVVPDVVLPDPAAFVESGERYLEHSIPWSEVEPLEYDKWNGHAWDTDTLVARSAARRGAHSAFAKIDARANYLKTRREDTVVSLARDSWLSERERDKQALEAVDPKLEEGAPRFEVNVLRSSANDKASTDDWKKTLARDPWVEEALHILGDMNGAG